MSDAPKPICAGKTPVKCAVEEGKTYYWCACGRSASQPLCDGSHKGCGIAPQAFTAEKPVMCGYATAKPQLVHHSAMAATPSYKLEGLQLR